MQIFDQLESEVRSYIRAFPTVFTRSKDANLYNEDGREYIDFFAGAGTLNYGHNNDVIKEAMITYLQDDGVVHALDMATSAKKRFLETFHSTILRPRNLPHKVQFTGPTGTNAVETALKLARKATGRGNIVCFTNGFHGQTMGSTSITGNQKYRHESYINRSNATFMPFDGYLGQDVNTIDYLRKALEDGSSGLDQPAAVIVETIQAEGGVNVAHVEWLQELELLCREFEILLIIDDIQVGNGRTGRFFSFEEAGISPDMITISKSIGGGLPMAILLIKPEIDVWGAGEHTGTFRGNNLAFVAAEAAVSHFWKDDAFSQSVIAKGEFLHSELEKTTQEFPSLNASVRGRGMIQGLVLSDGDIARDVSAKAFEKGVVIERSGASGQVVKFLPPLTIDDETLNRGLEIINESIAEIL